MIDTSLSRLCPNQIFRCQCNFHQSAEFFTVLSEERKPLIDYNSVPDNGIQVLKRLRENPNYDDIPVVILSDSNLGKYRNECYRCGASSFIKKPDTTKATNQKIASFFNTGLMWQEYNKCFSGRIFNSHYEQIRRCYYGCQWIDLCQIAAAETGTTEGTDYGTGVGDD